MPGPRLFLRAWGPKAPLHHKNNSAKQGAQCHCENNFVWIGRENEGEAAALHERRETGNAKGHQEKPKRLPGIEFHFCAASRSGADIKCNSNDESEAEGGQPKPRIGIEVAHQHDGIPDEITPEDQSASVQSCEISDQHWRD